MYLVHQNKQKYVNVWTTLLAYSKDEIEVQYSLHKKVKSEDEWNVIFPGLDQLNLLYSDDRVLSG